MNNNFYEMSEMSLIGGDFDEEGEEPTLEELEAAYLAERAFEAEQAAHYDEMLKLENEMAIERDTTQENGEPF